MKHLLLAFLFILLTASTCHQRVETKIEQSTMIEYSDTLSKQQLDSIFIADTISPDIENDWIQSFSIAESKKEMFYKYAYIKNITDSTGVIYILSSYQDSLFILTKRTSK